MNRRQLILGVLAVGVVQAVAVWPALAATFVEQIVTQLQAQGFKNIEVETTWLGRARIQAQRAETSREIVLNPNTGEILRDLWLSKSGVESQKVTIGDDGGDDNSEHGGGGNGGTGGGDDRDDDKDSGSQEHE